MTPPLPPEKKKDSLPVYLLKTTIEVAGFGGMMRAVLAKENRRNKILKSLGSKTVDIVAFKTVEVALLSLFLLGIGAGTPALVLAAEIGVVNALYVYGKFYLLERFQGPKEQRKKAKIFSKERLLKSGIAFTLGSTGGLAVGVAQSSGYLQPVLEPVNKFLMGGKGLLSRVFHIHALPHLPIPAPGSAPGKTPNLRPAV